MERIYAGTKKKSSAAAHNTLDIISTEFEPVSVAGINIKKKEIIIT